MIAINSRGDFCHGRGGSFFNINNVPVMPGASFGWMDDDTAAMADGRGLILPGEFVASKYHAPTQTTTPLNDPPTGAQSGYAGGGHAAWWWGKGGGTFSTTGWNGPGTGLLGMGPDGAIGYKPNYQSNGPTMVRGLDGSEWLLTTNHAYDLQLLGARRALFTDSVAGFTVIGIPMPQRLPGACWFPQAFELGGRWWFGCQYDRFGVVAHPFDDPKRGYLIVAPGIDAWPTFRALDANTLMCVWSNSIAEQAGQLTPRRFDLRTDPLVDLVWLDPAPIPKPPKIAVSSYDALLKAGEPWHLEFTNNGDGTRVIVTKDVRDRLWIEADNAAGHDRTGTVRQLTIEGHDPEPEPEPEPPPMLRRYWFQPNIGSKDLLDLFDDPSHLLGLDVVVLYAQHVLTDVATPQLGPNTWPNFVAHDAVRKLKDAGRPLVIEMGSVKDGDCQALANIAGMQEILQRVHDAGGQVAAFSADEPITNSRACHQSLAQTAEGHATWTHAVRALGPIEVGWLEAWPAASLDEQRLFLQELKAHDALPDYWHLDINWHDAEHQHKNPAAFIDAAKVLAAQYGITLGIFVNSTVDPIPTDLQHHQNVTALAQKIYGIVPDIAHVSVAAWATRDGTTATQNVPNNLGAVGLLQTFTDVAALFAGTPTQEIDPMLYKLMDPTTAGIIRLKQLKPLDGTPGKFTAVLPDDRVASIQPDGSFETRDPGTAGEYEQCYADNGLLFYEPKAEKRYAWAYRLLPA
jgi:hypothetical protein